MSETVLYLGSDVGTLERVLHAGADERSPTVYATTCVSDAIDRLIDDEFDYLLISTQLSTSDVELFLRIADADASTRTLCQRGVVDTLDERFVDLIDGTFDPTETGDPLGEVESPPADSARHVADSGGSTDEQETTKRLACIHSDGTYLWVNDAMAASIDFPDGDIVGSSIADAQPMGFHGTLQAVWTRAVQTGTERRVVTSDDDSRRVISVRPIDDDRFILLEKSQETDFTLDGRYLDRLSDMFFIVDFSGNLVYWNEVVNDVTGYRDPELVDINALELFAPEDREHGMEKLAKVRSSGEQSVRVQLLTKEGEKIPYQFSGSLIEGGHEGEQYVCGVGRDISNQVEMQAEIESVIDELRQSNDELEHFAYVASHDLKEPLRTVKSFLELLEARYSDELDDDGEEYIEFATDGVARMSSMIDDLLEYSRIDGDATLEVVDSEEVFREALKNLQLTIEESDAQVSSDPLPTVAADRSLLVQLFQNLLDNAIKHAEERPRVHVTADKAGEMIQFTVRDENEGMTDAEAADIFELFSSGHDETGTGIGLATCRKIVESHGGSIGVESEKGVGSVFYFTLPETPPADSDVDRVAVSSRSWVQSPVAGSDTDGA